MILAANFINRDFLNLFETIRQAPPPFLTCFLLTTAFVHVILAVGVRRDACRQNRDDGAGTFLVGENIWGLITLLTGLPGFALYWLIHHSTPRPANGRDDDAPR